MSKSFNMVVPSLEMVILPPDGTVHHVFNTRVVGKPGLDDTEIRGTYQSGTIILGSAFQRGRAGSTLADGTVCGL